MPVGAKLVIQGGKQWIIKASESTSDILMVFKGLYTSVMEWNTHWIMWVSSPFTHWFYICRRVCTYSCVCGGALGQQALSSEIRSITETGAHIMTRQTGQWVPEGRWRPISICPPTACTRARSITPSSSYMGTRDPDSLHRLSHLSWPYIWTFYHQQVSHDFRHIVLVILL